MAVRRLERPTFTFNRGLNTDAPLVTFPENFSTDELNFELMLDGTRRRRRGLEQETEDTVIDTTQPSDAAVRTFKWRSVAGNPDLNFHCIQIGSFLYFYDDVPEPSDSPRNFFIDLETIAVSGFEDNVGDTVIDMAFGRGHALVVGYYLEPSYIIYDPDEDDVTILPVNLRERDFQGVDDGIDNVTQPSGTINTHIYNLVNQGWIYGNILTFQTDQGSYPSKNMLQWLGYRRATVAGYNVDDGTKEFSPDKLIAEVFQDAPAPKGHFIQNPFDTTVNVIVETETIKNYKVGTQEEAGTETTNGFTPWKPDPAYGFTLPAHGGGAIATNLLTINFQNPHFLSVGETFVLYTENNGRIGSFTGDGNRYWSIGLPSEVNPLWQTQTVEEVVSDNAVKFYHNLQDDGPGYRPGWIGASWPNVYAYVGGTVLEIEGTIIDERPTTTAFFAGRAVYAGIQHPSLASAIYFSQVVEVDIQYGKAYQVADPTDENISDIVPTDGLVIRIPEAGRIYKVQPYSSSLIVYASGGIWEIGPGQSGYFSATSYAVRKLSDVGAMNGTSVLEAENIPMYWGISGIMMIVQDTNTGYLTVRSMTRDTIDNFYSEISDAHRRTASGDFDRVNKRAIWTYTEGTSEEPEYKALVFDIRFVAWTPWTFQCQISDIFTTTDLSSLSKTTLRFIAYDANGYQMVVPTSLSFADLGTATDAYLVTGYDTASSPTRFKYAPVITVFSKRTEISDEFVPDAGGGGGGEAFAFTAGPDPLSPDFFVGYLIDPYADEVYGTGPFGTLVSNTTSFTFHDLETETIFLGINELHLAISVGTDDPGEDAFTTMTVTNTDTAEVVFTLNRAEADVPAGTLQPVTGFNPRRWSWSDAGPAPFADTVNYSVTFI